MIMDGWNRPETAAVQARNDLLAWVLGGLLWAVIVVAITGGIPYLAFGAALSFAMRRTLGLLFAFD